MKKHNRQLAQPSQEPNRTKPPWGPLPRRNNEPVPTEIINNTFDESEIAEPMSRPNDHVIDNEYRSISFSALADAQLELPPSSRSIGVQSDKTSVEKVRALQERLSELRKLKGGFVTPSKGQVEVSSNRSSKHAPTEQSSKHSVSRKRPAFELLNNPYNSRDPRFSSTSGKLNENTVRKRYAFLKDYENSELAELKAVLKRTKDSETKERLKRQIMSMENKIKSEHDKDRRKKVLREHRRQEKEAVKQGKKPFYLKKSEQKRLTLTEKFENMGTRERDRAIQRRRKKEDQREKRKIPANRKLSTD